MLVLAQVARWAWQITEEVVIRTIIIMLIEVNHSYFSGMNKLSNNLYFIF